MLPCRLDVLPARMPPVTIVPPEYVLAPPSTSVPAPVLTSDPPPEIDPANTPFAPFTPAVNVPPPRKIPPLPFSDENDCEKPPRSTAPPALTCSAPPPPSALDAPERSVPSETTVGPV